MKIFAVILFKENSHLLASLLREVKNIESLSPKTKIVLTNGEKIILKKVIEIGSFPIKALYPIPEYLRRYNYSQAVWGFIVTDKKVIPLVHLKKLFGGNKDEKR